MQVEVSDWARERIAEMVADGRVRSESEAVEYALAALTDDESFGDHDQTWWGRLAELDAEADEDVRQRRLRPADDAFFAALHGRAASASERTS